MKTNIKHTIVLSILVILSASFPAKLSAQKELPAVTVATMSSKPFPIKNLLSDSLPVVISFWHTACKPCLQELDAVAENYDQWQETVKFKFVAVTIDDARSLAKATVMANGRNWPFMVLSDSRQVLSKAMNVTVTPATFIIDKSGNIVYTHIGYTPGSEKELLEKLKQLE